MTIKIGNLIYSAQSIHLQLLFVSLLDFVLDIAPNLYITTILQKKILYGRYYNQCYSSVATQSFEINSVKRTRDNHTSESIASPGKLYVNIYSYMKLSSYALCLQHHWITAFFQSNDFSHIYHRLIQYCSYFY